MSAFEHPRFGQTEHASEDAFFGGMFVYIKTQANVAFLAAFTER